jgi:hypothetical protein
VDPVPVEVLEPIAINSCVLADGKRGAVGSPLSFLFSISLFPIFLSGVGVRLRVSVFGFGVFPSPFFLRQGEQQI